MDLHREDGRVSLAVCNTVLGAVRWSDATALVPHAGGRLELSSGRCVPSVSGDAPCGSLALGGALCGACLTHCLYSVCVCVCVCVCVHACVWCIVVGCGMVWCACSVPRDVR